MIKKIYLNLLQKKEQRSLQAGSHRLVHFYLKNIPYKTYKIVDVKERINLRENRIKKLFLNKKGLVRKFASYSLICGRYQAF